MLNKGSRRAATTSWKGYGNERAALRVFCPDDSLPPIPVALGHILVRAVDSRRGFDRMVALMKILQWLGGGDTGLSSKAIALAALGEMPRRPDYPRDGDDFGRCIRLLALCPDAKVGLERLGKDGGPQWQSLVPRWTDIELAYWQDKDLYERGIRDYKQYKCYDLMRSIYAPKT